MGYVRVYHGDELIDQMAVGQQPLTIGRTDDNRLVLPDKGVSRRHAIIFQEGGHWFVQDLDSSNGVFFRKKRIRRQQLQYWDEIQIQQFMIRFMATPAASAGAGLASGKNDDDEQTRFVHLDSAHDLEQLSEARREAWLSYTREGAKRCPITGPSLSIGRSREADIRLPGWFAPAEAARIERVARNFRLVPRKRGQVEVDGAPIQAPVILEDGTRIAVRGQPFTFYHRLFRQTA